MTRSGKMLSRVLSGINSMDHPLKHLDPQKFPVPHVRRCGGVSNDRVVQKTARKKE